MTLTLALLAVLSATAFIEPPAVAAHPLGNFTVNHYTGLTVRPDRIDAVAVVDRAEISTAQERPSVDRDQNGAVDAAERRSHARGRCTALARGLRVEMDASRVAWKLSAAQFTYQPGEGGLRTSRLRCALTAGARPRSPSDITVRTTYDSGRVGWHEITARGRGVTLTRSTVPAASATDELRRYPQDPLAAPLNQRTATLRVEAGDSGPPPPGPAGLPGAGPVTAALDKVAGVFHSLVGTRRLTVPVGLLALLLAVVLGASHAAMPGHGKTVMAAYLAGRRGTPRDAVTVGATVTLTHTAGVLVLGLLLPVATALAGEAVLLWLGLASGLLITAIGLRLLRSAVLHRRAHVHHDHHHHGGTRRGSLIGMGIAGGLVPSPSALVVLLGAVALGRTAFGVLLVIGYGLGMAATLTLAGLLLIRLRDRIAAATGAPGASGGPLPTLRKRLSRIGPVATATLIVLVGLGLTLRALPGGL
ncbi:nickel/cobalt transporter [Streptomyces sp. NPDC052236]|uniref:nickel/cobalt transporter n=1 Tax=Streptomyces sp. NPDC052236 TaxID=3365686 RepID=UPI0037D8F411